MGRGCFAYTLKGEPGCVSSWSRDQVLGWNQNSRSLRNLARQRIVGLVPKHTLLHPTKIGSQIRLQMTDITIIRIDDLQVDPFSELLAESKQLGFQLVRRLIDEWEDGRNRFNQPGEALFVAYSGTRIVGVCGLNVDPFAENQEIGRVRRLYVLSAFRRLGIGRRLIQEVISLARNHFRILRLRTNTNEANLFYCALGFQKYSDETNCTHLFEIH
jgi:GNAT superfamily N-acetyltransferase